MNDEQPTGERQLLARVAYGYFIEGRTQEEIGRQLGFSRPKVQRLLERARETGVVEIRIVGSSDSNLALEARLRASFGLKDAIVTPNNPDPQMQRQALARAAAEYLERHVPNRGVIAVGMGRNTGELARYYRPPRRLECTFVSAMGGSPSVDAPTNPNDICRALAERSGGQSESLFAPAYVESREVRDQVLRQEAVAHSLRIAATAGIALVGIGGTDDACTMVRSGCCPLEEMVRLRARGAVGDILGNYFDVTGRVIASDLNDRLVGLTLADLRRVGTAIAVVSEADKSAAVLGALRTGVLDVLIVHEAIAGLLVDATGDEPAASPKARRPSGATERGS